MSTHEQQPALELVRWTLELRETVRQKHRRVVRSDKDSYDWCETCGEPHWPCPSLLYAAALDALDALEAQVTELRAALRLFLEDWTFTTDDPSKNARVEYEHEVAHAVLDRTAPKLKEEA